MPTFKGFDQLAKQVARDPNSIVDYLQGEITITCQNCNQEHTMKVKNGKATCPGCDSIINLQLTK